MDKVLLSTGKDDWETPIDFFNKLDEEFHFTLDPCCTHATAKCEKHFTPAEDGLKQSWKDEVVFVNPPYSKKTKDNAGQAVWIQKAYEESERATVVMLIPARTDTIAFHEYIYGKAEIRFVKGRLKFGGAKDAAPLDNCMGSGSTGVACVNTNRSFIGMELDEGYFEIAKKRIKEAEQQLCCLQ